MKNCCKGNCLQAQCAPPLGPPKPEWAHKCTRLPKKRFFLRNCRFSYPCWYWIESLWSFICNLFQEPEQEPDFGPSDYYQEILLALSSRDYSALSTLTLSKVMKEMCLKIKFYWPHIAGDEMLPYTYLKPTKARNLSAANNFNNRLEHFY